MRTAAKDSATRGGAPATQPQTPFRPLESILSPARFSPAAKFAQKLSRSIKSSSGKRSGRRAVRGPEWGSDADPQCSRRWLNAISPPASHGSALMCWNASGVPAQMPVKSMWKLRSELRKRWNVDWAAEEWKGGRTEDFGEGVAACRHSPRLSHFGQIPHTPERPKNTGVKSYPCHLRCSLCPCPWAPPSGRSWPAWRRSAPPRPCSSGACRPRGTRSLIRPSPDTAQG